MHSAFVQAILDCFHPQYKFLCYDGPGFLKAGNFPLCDGDKGENAWKNPPSVPLAAMDKVISMGRLIRPFLFPSWRAAASCVDAAGNIKYAAAFPNFGRCEGRGSLDLARGLRGGGHLGIFVRHERALVPGARGALGVVCAGPDSEEMPHKPRMGAYTRMII